MSFDIALFLRNAHALQEFGGNEWLLKLLTQYCHPVAPKSSLPYQFWCIPMMNLFHHSAHIFLFFSFFFFLLIFLFWSEVRWNSFCQVTMHSADYWNDVWCADCLKSKTWGCKLDGVDSLPQSYNQCNEYDYRKNCCIFMFLLTLY